MDLIQKLFEQRIRKQDYESNSFLYLTVLNATDIFLSILKKHLGLIPILNVHFGGQMVTKVTLSIISQQMLLTAFYRAHSEVFVQKKETEIELCEICLLKKIIITFPQYNGKCYVSEAYSHYLNGLQVLLLF